MQFLKLTLAGFKSFIDSTELPIEPGLTGIVGPNGCGKSNLVEALRWSMGETSAKQMRGGEMDDVIFSGTSERPARNLAEVILHLDNRDRMAPAMFNDQSELQVSRRIERGEGSLYRVNGSDVRGQGRPASVRRCDDRRTVDSPGEPGPDRRHHQREAAGSGAACSRRRRESPACTAAAMRPSFACAPRKRI